MHILFYKLTCNLKFFFFHFYLYRDHLEACSSGTWRSIQKILKLCEIHHIRMILSLITYPLPSPKIKPRYQVYANVSKPPPPPIILSKFKFISYLHLMVHAIHCWIATPHHGLLLTAILAAHWTHGSAHSTWI